MTVSIMVVEDESLVALDIAERLRSLGCAVPCMVSTGVFCFNGVRNYVR